MQSGLIPILRIGSTLLATIQTELRDTTAQAFQQDVLKAIEKSRARGLIIDITGLDMVDTFVARILTDTGRMALLMGAHTVLCGMRPEVAATLVRMGFVMQGVHTALNIDDGMELLARLQRAQAKG
ncbi:STAS domain-containing protein [Hyalangium gracile]|uniref:STAS domain-containing protein n=1 Tax=Hyalangium gracile TaxID=394092 RepID=UPI001CCF6C72|nr:STAS domain-containing protein [Hyalangium gracile]